ncbi:MAG TPA: MFS transporter, partial [Bacteroidota bacterium]|nr:MFS transporter [Bacteroidota bacterium]
IPVLFISEERQLREAERPGEGPGATDWGQLWRIYGAHAFSWIGVQAMFVYIIAFIQQKMPFGGAPEEAARQTGQVISISFAILNSVGFLLPAFVLEPLAKRFGRVRVHMLSVGSMALGYFGVSVFAAGPLALYLLMGLLGVGWASIVSLPFAIMSEKVEKSRMGFYMGIFNLSVVLPQLFVSLVLGKVVLDAPDKSIIFLISGASLAVSALGWLLVRERIGGGMKPLGVGGGH